MIAEEQLTDLAAYYRSPGEEVVSGAKVCLVSRPTQYSNGAYHHHFQVWRPDHDYNDAVELRAEIAKQGLEQQFVEALYDESELGALSLEEIGELPGWRVGFILVNATPGQTARAFVTAMEQEHE